MTKEIKLKAEKREKENLNELRKSGKIPAIVYGAGKEAENISLETQEFLKVFKIAGESQLVDLNLGLDKSIKVIIKDVQYNPVKDTVVHADLYKVDMKKPIEIEIPLNFIGSSKAEKELGGNLLKNIETLHAKCLPGDLIERIDVDISALNTFEDSIKVSDLKIPEKIEVLSPAEELIVHVTELAVEEEPEPVAEAGAEGEEKKAGAEGEEKKAGAEGEEKKAGAEAKEKKEKSGK